MQKAFDLIVERLEELHKNYRNKYLFGKGNLRVLDGCQRGLEDAIEIVNQVAEEYKSNDGWIPVEERYPDTDKYILLSLSNFSIPIVGRYEEDENGGAFYAGDEDMTLVSQDLFVNAWMPLVKPYRPDEEESARTNGDRIRSMSDEELAAAMLELGVDACEKIPFCVNSDKCNEIMDAGELIPSDLCRKCLIKWLKS